MKLREIFLEAFDDCGCSGEKLSEGLQYHVDNDRPLTENIYRPFSKIILSYSKKLVNCIKKVY